MRTLFVEMYQRTYHEERNLLRECLKNGYDRTLLPLGDSRQQYINVSIMARFNDFAVVSNTAITASPHESLGICAG